ncbi:MULTISPECIES: FHA domain-containing protein [Mycobacterium]|nr:MULTISPECIES: FHA domain-containing protein [Mycobacterium]
MPGDGWRVAARRRSMAHMRHVAGLPSGAAMLIVKRGPNVGSRFLLDRPATSVGSHPASDVMLDDVTVDSHHAEFLSDGGQFRLIDADSRGGTYLNRELVHSAELHNGDEITIGQFRLMFLRAR